MPNGEEGNNINGPSLIRVPDWITNRLGKYYLYFAHHLGKYIRLAYADNLRGPYKLHKKGTLHLNETLNSYHHIASPDVHVDNANKKIIMYFHSPVKGKSGQFTLVSESDNGLDFICTNKDILGFPYFRIFDYQGATYAVGKNVLNAVIYKKIEDSICLMFQVIHEFIPNSRHFAPLVIDDTLYLFHSNIGDNPESILCSKVSTETPDNWQVTCCDVILSPNEIYEGINEELRPSKAGAIFGLHREVRDPCIYTEDNKIYLIYSVGGENGLAIVDLNHF